MGLSLTEQPDLFTPASGLSEAALCHPSGARGFFAHRMDLLLQLLKIYWHVTAPV